MHFFMKCYRLEYWIICFISNLKRIQFFFFILIEQILYYSNAHDTYE
jgi:hypothetical protein